MLYSKRRKNLRGGRYKKHSKIKSNKRHHMIGGNLSTTEYSEKFPNEVWKSINSPPHYVVDILIKNKDSMITYLDSAGRGKQDLIYNALGFPLYFYNMKLPCNIEHTVFLAEVLDTMVKFNLKSLEEDLGPAMLYIYGEIEKNLYIYGEIEKNPDIIGRMRKSIYNRYFPSNYTTYTKKEMLNLVEQITTICQPVLESCNQTFHLPLLLLSIFFDMKEKYYRLKYLEKFPEEVKKIIEEHHNVTKSFEIKFRDELTLKEYLEGIGSKYIDMIYSALGFTPDVYTKELPCNIEHTVLLAAVLDTMVKFNLKSPEEDLGPAMLYIYGEIEKNLYIYGEIEKNPDIIGRMRKSIYNMYFPSNYTKEEMSNLVKQFTTTCQPVLESCDQTLLLQILLLDIFFEMKKKMKEKYYRLKYLEKFPEEVKKIIEEHHKVKNSYQIEFRDALTLKEYLEGIGSKYIDLIYNALGFPRYFYKTEFVCNIKHTALLAAILDTMVKVNLKSLEEDLGPAMLYIYGEIEKNPAVEVPIPMRESIYKIYFPSNYTEEELSNLVKQFTTTYKTVLERCDQTFRLQILLLAIFFDMKHNKK
jgi:hypothetical protein